MIIPSIDLMDGKAVQLVQGKEKVLEKENVLELAKEFSKYGEIAVIDLDAALGKGDNIELIKKICGLVDCRVGGGIRTLEKANELLAFGAKKVIVGTMASVEFLKQLPKERLIVAVDAKKGKVVDKGWTRILDIEVIDRVKELQGYCSEFLFTDVDREGMMKGIDADIISGLKKFTQDKITVAGGITTYDDILAIERLGMNSQIGMALYTGKIKLEDAFISVLDFEKGKGLVPTIVQDENGRVLMLANSTKKSLRKSFEMNNGVYYSRSRKKLWWKGETSGNVQELIKVRFDCDRDALLFTVKQKDVACHTGSYSCFGDKDFRLEDLYGAIVDRMNNPKKGSYTSKILADEEMIKAKIKEESQEVLNYIDKDNLTWECGDLLYFLLVLMAKKGVALEDVKNELWRRRK